MFDQNQTETIKTNTYGLPESAKFDVKTDDKFKSRAEGTLTWKPTKLDKGFHTIVIETVNSKDFPGRISLSYDVR